MIPTAINMLSGTDPWFSTSPTGRISCKLLQFAQGSSVACSIFPLTALAFGRFFGIVFQMWKVVSMRRTLLIILVIWLAVIAISWPFLYAGTVVSLSDGVPLCVEDWGPAFDAERAPRIFTIVSFVFLYALALLVISVLYVVIVAKVWRRRTPGNITQANRRVLNMS